MLRHRHIDRICCGVMAFTIMLTMGFMGAGALGLIGTASAMGYEDALFDAGEVHTIDIVMEDWDSFIESCENEEYVACTVVIDGEKFSNVAIRAKGNTSLSSVQQYGNGRYSFKIEFDHYDNGVTYHGLDKLSLNNLIQDSTFMKDYIVYAMMGKMGVAAPLCSYVYITVNDEDWGLYLAVEGVEESFIRRNYGADGGELYKPDSMSFGGGRGNGKDFDMEAFKEEMGWAETDATQTFAQAAGAETTAEPDEMSGDSDTADALSDMDRIRDGMGQALSGSGEMPADIGEMPEGMGGLAENMGGAAEGTDGENAAFGFEKPDMSSFGGMGSSDVKLQYIDDDHDSYSNIFDNAVTDVSDTDKTRLIASLKALSEGDVESSVDMEQVARYFAVHDFVRNDDSYTGSMIHNYYLYEDDGVLSMVPWDYNLAFGGFAGGSASAQVNSPIDTPVSDGDLESRPMVAWLFSSDEYTALYHVAYGQLISEICDSGWLDSEIVRVSGMIAPYVEKDENAFFSYEEFERGVAALRQFCTLRAQSVSGQLSGEIPSTEDGQSADSALISADGLNLSDMGGMNAGGGRGMGGMAMPEGMELPEGITMPEGMQMPQAWTEESDIATTTAERTEDDGAAASAEAMEADGTHVPAEQEKSDEAGASAEPEDADDANATVVPAESDADQSGGADVKRPTQLVQPVSEAEEAADAQPAAGAGETAQEGAAFQGLGMSAPGHGESRTSDSDVSMQQSGDNTLWLTLGSTGILLLGIIVAALFRSRNI